jgi:small-conductance mechanosensitive channel
MDSMASAHPAHHPEHGHRPRLLSGLSLWLILALAVLLAACLLYAWITRGAMSNLAFLHRSGGAGRAASGAAAPLVDTRSWQAAQALSSLAVSSEEKELAREAERLAEHEVEQAFAAALREAAMNQPTLTGDALQLSREVAQLHQTVAADQAAVDKLSKSAPASASGDLDIAKAQLALDTDELADAQQDLARAGGDDRQQIEQELAAHQAVVKQYDAQIAAASDTAVASARRHGSLAARLGALLDQRTRSQSLVQAIGQANAAAAALASRHDALEKQSNAPPAAGNAAATVAALKNKSARSQLMAIYDDRIETDKQLAAVYGKWSDQLASQHAILLHLLAQSVALVLFLLVAIIVLDALAQRFVERPSLDRRRAHTLRVVFKLGIEIAGGFLILLVVFGAPNQMPTIVGFTTAGLTVVLQDFIIAFLGWFVLMGKGGVRVGDWVEINGVSGEVAEIGLFRTALLETGNWTDKGHPTGRRITFLNSFAIKGQYFNFSTSSQWMWDEIRFGVPGDGATSGLIDQIHRAVVEETEEDARQAEAEWKHGASRSAFSHLSAAPAVEMRPAASGIDLVVRYVARASHRLEARNRLYGRVIGLLHKPPA